MKRLIFLIPLTLLGQNTFIPSSQLCASGNIMIAIPAPTSTAGAYTLLNLRCMSIDPSIIVDTTKNTITPSAPTQQIPAVAFVGPEIPSAASNCTSGRPCLADGKTVTFTVNGVMIPYSSLVFKNGTLLTVNIDYIVTGINTFDFKVAPVATDVLRVYYSVLQYLIM